MLFQKTFATFLDAVLPWRCIGCGSEGSALCQRCEKTARALKRHNHTLYVHSENRIIPVHVWSAFEYAGIIRSVLKHFKYHHLSGLHGRIATLITEQMPHHSRGFGAVLTCVPLNSRRLAERRYNQSELIARSLGLLLDLPFEQTLEKTKSTAIQAGLDRNGRLRNVLHAFRALNVRPCNYVLVDDVMTTGSTLKECARTLLNAGAARVSAITFAYEPFESSNQPEPSDLNASADFDILP